MASLLSQAFKNSKSENRPALLTYTVAGDNTKKKSLEILKTISMSLLSQDSLPHSKCV